MLVPCSCFTSSAGQTAFWFCTDLPSGSGAQTCSSYLPFPLQQLRLKRLAEMHVRMAQQLEEKQARDVAEASEKEQKVDLRNSVVKPRIEAWTAGKKASVTRVTLKTEEVKQQSGSHPHTLIATCSPDAPQPACGVLQPDACLGQGNAC